MDSKAETPAPNRRSWLVAAPLVLFVGFAILIYPMIFKTDKTSLPSPLIGRPAPRTSLPALDGLQGPNGPVPGLDASRFTGAVTLVNVWASWCVPCADEAPLFMKLAQDTRIRVVGVNYKDSADNARRFLSRYGNPYSAIGVDANGRAGIEWGVYGVPETFIVGKDGAIAYKLVGPLTPDNIDAVVRVQIEKALAKG
jgi:cytochrome c biogenesis protein CcmG, thiol:disulfide interchange protein DsbE